MTADQFAQLVALRQAGGNREQAPSAAAAEVDGGIVAAASGEGCEHIGLVYRPFTWHPLW